MSQYPALSDIPLNPITLASPHFNSLEYLDLYLPAIEALDYPKDLLHILLVDNESTDKTYIKLQQWVDKHKSDGYASIRLIKHSRMKKAQNSPKLWMTNITSIMNRLRNECETDLVILGSDCIPPPDGIKKLARMRMLGAAVCGGITVVLSGTRVLGGQTYTNCPTIPAYVRYPNTILFIPITSDDDKPPDKEIIPASLVDRIIPCHAVGTGFSLIRKVIKDNVPFEHSPFLGEDMNYGRKVLDLGYKIMVDTSLFYDHLHYEYYKHLDPNGNLIIAGIRSKRSLLPAGILESIQDPSLEAKEPAKVIKVVLKVVPMEMILRDVYGEPLLQKIVQVPTNSPRLSWWHYR